jgi:hypothetical protein
MRIAVRLIICFTLIFGVRSAFAQKAKIDSTAAQAALKDTAAFVEEEFEMPIAGVLNDQETRSGRADFFPIDLAQRGRQATSAYLGMPPGLFQFQYAGNQLSNPVTGFWNELAVFRKLSLRRFRILQNRSPGSFFPRIT